MSSRHKALFLSILLLSIISCITAMSQPSVRQGEAQNLIDDNGQRQGYWVITGAICGEPGYKKNQTVEEGLYEDNKRQGLWKKYYPSGSVKSEINYENNHPKGTYKVYYLNGKVEEEGNWASNKNIGQYRRFHQNGKPACEFTFNEAGKRHGEQRYYYETGHLQMTVEVENGVAHGMLRTWHPDGQPREDKRLTNGQVEPESIVQYKSKSNAPVRMPEIPAHETRPDTDDKPNLGEFKHNGFNTLYNKNLQITQVGEFRDGRLWDGKWHRYDENGLLKKVEVFKNGKFTGYAVIEDGNY